MYICTQNGIFPGPIISYIHFHFITMPETFLVPGHVEELNFENIKSRPGWTSIDCGKGSKQHKVRVAGMFDIHVSFKLIPALRYLPKANFVFNLRW